MKNIARFIPAEEGFAQAPILAKALGMNEHYFTDAIHKESGLSPDVKIANFNGHWYVSIPPEYYKLFDDGFLAMKVDLVTLDEVKFEKFFRLSRQTEIGFYRL